MIILDNKRCVFFGLMGSGKTELVKHVLRSTKSHLVYDPLNEYNGFTRYVPDDRQSVSELNDLVEGMVIPQKPRLFIIDEANKYIRPKPQALPSGIADLNDLSRHWDIAWGAVCRRPTQFHTDIVELAHYLFIFPLHGKNDRHYLNDLKAGLGDTVDSLPEHYFAVVSELREILVHAPLEINGKAAR